MTLSKYIFLMCLYVLSSNPQSWREEAIKEHYYEFTRQVLNQLGHEADQGKISALCILYSLYKQFKENKNGHIDKVPFIRQRLSDYEFGYIAGKKFIVYEYVGNYIKAEYIPEFFNIKERHDEGIKKELSQLKST